MDTTNGFKEVHITRPVFEAWKASPMVAARAAQIKAFAQHQNLRLDTEGLTRVNEMWALLDQTAGPTPSVGEFV